jgi:hypothetical protein
MNKHILPVDDELNIREWLQEVHLPRQGRITKYDCQRKATAAGPSPTRPGLPLAAFIMFRKRPNRQVSLVR